MHIFKKLCAQATVCSVLLSHTMGVDMASPAQPQTPPYRGQTSRALSPQSSPLKKMSIQLFQEWQAANREWYFDGRRVIFCDLEADPTIGGPITEATFIETQRGEATGEVRHYYFNPEKKVTHPKVKNIAPIDPKQQPTFSQRASDIYDFIKGATLVTYGSFDARKLIEHFSYQPPYGAVYTITYVDALMMVKHDYARKQGVEVAPTPHKVVSTTSRSRSQVVKEQAAKRKANRDKKETQDLNKFLKRQDAKRKGLPSPQRKPRESIYDGESFSQSKVAKRNGITDRFGAASIGLDADQTYADNNIPPAHRGEDHHAFPDTLTLAGLGTLLTQSDANILATRRDFASAVRVLNFADADIGESDESHQTNSENDDDDFGGEHPVPQRNQFNVASLKRKDRPVTQEEDQEPVSGRKRLRSANKTNDKLKEKENVSQNSTQESSDTKSFIATVPPKSPVISSQTKRAKSVIKKVKKEKEEQE